MSQTERPRPPSGADPVAVGITLLAAVASTLVLLFAIFVVGLTENTDAPEAPISALLVGFLACIAGWTAFRYAADDRSVATGLSLLGALLADVATVWLLVA